MNPTKRRLAVVALVVLVGALGWRALRVPFPPGDTPEGAYARIAIAIAQNRPRDAFPYLETEAQWACHSIHDTRRAALLRVRRSYPESERPELERDFAELGSTADGEDVFVRIAEQRGWIARLRRDLSASAHVEIAGERATVVTARGTRYALRKRDNGIWGLTMFTASLVAERDKATRDLAVVSAAADDYDRAKR